MNCFLGKAQATKKDPKMGNVGLLVVFGHILGSSLGLPVAVPVPAGMCPILPIVTNNLFDSV